MTNIKIKQLTDQEQIFDIFHRFPYYAFGASPPLINKEAQTEDIKSRLNVKYFVLFEDGAPASTSASVPMTQNVRGKLFPMSGIYNVVTMPEFRWKGYSKKTLIELLKADKNAGKVFSTLYPFKESFYEKLGYTVFQEPLKINFKTSSLMPLIKMNLQGKIEYTLLEDNYQVYCDYLKTTQTEVHGMGYFDKQPFVNHNRNPQWLAVAKIDDKVTGVMTYKLDGDDKPIPKIRISRFVYSNHETRYLLLEWIARHNDQVTEAEIRMPTYDEHPNTWLPNLSPEISKLWIAPMGRILNISQISGMQVGKGQFTAKITDSQCPWNEGLWKFENENGLLKVSPAQSADCELTIQGISSLIYGTHHPEIFQIRGWGNPTIEVQQRMINLFPARIAYLHEHF